MVSFKTNTNPWRLAVNKLLIAAAAAFFAVTALFGSGAQAGFNVRLNVPAGFSTVEKAGCGGGGYRRVYRKRRYQSARRRTKPKVQVVRKADPAPAKIAKAEAKDETKSKIVENENSSISTLDGKVAKTETAQPEKKVAVAKELGCKQFFPSVGMTLTVPCQ
jgi:hypothetical protein